MAKPGRSRIKWARWGLGGAVLAIVAATLFLLFAPRPVPVDLATVSRGPIAETVADQGYARAREAYVVSAPVSGRLERVDLHVGDRVTAGQTVVARIRPTSAEFLDPRARAQAQAATAAAAAAVSAAQARQDQLAAEARRAEVDAARTRALAEAGVVSRQALDNAEAQAKTTAAALRAARAEVGQRRSQLDSAQAALLGPEAPGAGIVPVTSPASGKVTRVLQESERTVQTGTPLVEVSDQAGLEAAIEFLSQDAVRIREGMPAEVFDWGGPGVLPAVVRRVEPQGFTKVSALGVEEQRAVVLLQFSGPEAAWARLGPGYRLWGRVILRRAPDALKAPLGALVRTNGRWAVYRMVANRAQLTPVQVGAFTDREAEITSGLGSGERVIVFPSDKIRDGARVSPRSVH
jgi:HlyD family secretion protein